MEQLEIGGNKSVRSIQTDIIKSEWQVILSGPCYLNDIDGLISLSLMATTKKRREKAPMVSVWYLENLYTGLDVISKKSSQHRVIDLHQQQDNDLISRHLVQKCIVHLHPNTISMKICPINRDCFCVENMPKIIYHIRLD